MQIVRDGREGEHQERIVLLRLMVLLEHMMNLVLVLGVYLNCAIGTFGQEFQDASRQVGPVACEGHK